MAEILAEDYLDVDISVNIVWISMVVTDNEAEAQRSSKLFRDVRVRQFWDAARICGTAFARHVFQGWARLAFSSLIPSERSSATAYVHSDAPPEQWPAWDIVLFYEKGIQWKDHPPIPVHWICQHSFHGKQRDGTSGLFWRNDFGAKPFASDWSSEIRQGVALLLKGDTNYESGDRARRLY